MVPSKSQLITIAMTLGALWAINNVGAFSPVKDFIEG